MSFMHNKIRIVDIENSEQLIAYFQKISHLFERSFEKALDADLWRWAYIENPFGNPIVSIALDEDRVVGHYAVIPMEIENYNCKLSGFLSMTTMVHPDYRRHDLFRTLAERVYDVIRSRKIPAVVFGFPNDNSAPSFGRKLGWEISEKYRVVSCSFDNLESLRPLLQSAKDPSAYSLNLNKKEIYKWRSQKPNQQWLEQSGIGLKKISDFEYDLMHIFDIDSFSQISKKGKVSFLLSVSDEEIKANKLDICFPYRFGFRAFNMDSTPTFFVQMSMSDIF